MGKLLKIGESIGVFLMFFVLSQISSFVVGLIQHMNAKIDHLLVLLLSFTILGNVWLMIYLVRKLGILLSMDFLNTKAIGMIGLGILGMFLTMILTISIFGSKNTSNQEILDKLVKSMPKLVMFFMIVVGAPVMEEITFRGIIMGKYLNKFPLTGLLVSSLIFGLIHCPKTISELTTYGSMGLVLGFIYLKSKCLEINICVHAIWNFLVFLVMLSQIK